MKKRVVLACMLCMALSSATYAEAVEGVASQQEAQSNNITVKGKVVDETGEPIIGAAVTIPGTTSGTVTDFNGEYSLSVPANGQLSVSFIGYSTALMDVNGQTTIDFTLVSDMTELDELVVVGYGTQRKVDLTGSVAVVDAEEMKKVSNSNISTMLQGKAAGVQITTDGQPGADPSVRIRGIGSFGSTAPLYVIDGVPMGTTIRDFSPNDIETIQVLKDASAGAIYGSRAANGVIIITTKQGSKEQPMKIDYSGYLGVDNINKNVYEVMDAAEYSNFLGVSAANSGTTLPKGYTYNSTTGKYQFMDDTDTDWFDEVFKVGIRQNHNVNISGGGKNNTYNVGLDYFDQEGTLEGAGPNYTRFTARMNNTMEAKFVKLKLGLVYSHSSQDNMAISNASEYVQGLYGDVTNVLRGTLLMQPTIKAYDESTWVLDDKVGAASKYNYDAYGYGVYYDDIHGDISASNPLLVNNNLERNTLVDRIVATGSANVDLLDMVGQKNDNHKLNYNINLSYSKTVCKDYTWIGAWIQSNRVYLAKENEQLSEKYRTNTGALIENTLSYDGTFGNSHLNILVGQTFEKEQYHELFARGNNYPEPYYLQITNAEERDASSYESTHVLASYLGRLNYDFAGKYLVSATVRYDGSSRLSSEDRWEVFPSFSAGWRIDQEEFFPVDESIVNLLKIRGSYGVLGNENIGEYQYMSTIARNNMKYSFGGVPVSGSAISTFTNLNIAWEKKKSTSFGLDLGMFNNKLEFSAEYYKNVSEDLLYSVPVPESAGVSNTSVTMNAASMENSGLEFSLTYRNNDNELKYEVSANLTTTKNEVTSLGFGTDKYITGAYATYVGQEIGQFYGWEYEGIFRTQDQIDAHAVQNGAQVGDCAYKDQNEDGLINAEDQVVLGSGLPKVNFGLSARIEYKGFDLSVSTFGALKYKVSDDIENSLHGCYGWANKSVDMLEANRWSEDGSTYISSTPRTYVDRPQGADFNWNDLFSERMIQNANYWKIANVELGYNFNDDWFKDVVSGVRLYVSGQNLATITKYKGYNVDFAGGTFTPGYNFCSFPTPRTFMVGLRASF